MKISEAVAESPTKHVEPTRLKPSETVAEPTAKYTRYLKEVQQALAGRLSSGERRRLEAELRLLNRARFVWLNGVVHHYQDEGPRDGQPLVLVHGWDCSAFWWHHVVDPMVAAGYRVIIYDLKGHGFSGIDPGATYTIESFSADLRKLVEVLALPSQHIMAFSLGAAVALHYAAHYSEQVRSLVFLNFGVFSQNPLTMSLIPSMLDAIFNKVLRPITQQGLWFLPYVYARLFLAKNTPSVNDIMLGTLGVRLCDPEAVRVSAKELAKPEVIQSIPQQMQQLTQPVLLVAGKDDPVVRPESGRKLMAVAQNGSFMEIPRCGHVILFELPELVVQILRQHLRAATGNQEK